MSDRRQTVRRTPADEHEEMWERNERIREAELRADGRRSMGELLEEGVTLSSFASELASAPRMER